MVRDKVKSLAPPWLMSFAPSNPRTAENVDKNLNDETRLEEMMIGCPRRMK